jgi:hypothetical protein
MHLRWLGSLVVMLSAACTALAQPPAEDDPLHERYSVRGVEPMDYSGYFDFLDRVRAKAIADQTPDLRPGDPDLSGFVNFTVTTDAALRLWEVRILDVHVETEASGHRPLDVRLRWPKDVSGMEARFPFAAIRQAFERARLSEESPEWIAQRDRMWPDVSDTARRIDWANKPIDIHSCPKLAAGLRQIRDAPPPLELIPSFTPIGDKPRDIIVLIADGWSISLGWNGGPNQFDGGRANPDQGSELGRTLMRLVGDAEECAGLERTLP